MKNLFFSIFIFICIYGFLTCSENIQKSKEVEIISFDGNSGVVAYPKGYYSQAINLATNQCEIKDIEVKSIRKVDDEKSKYELKFNCLIFRKEL